MKILLEEQEIEQTLRKNNLWSITNYYFTAQKSIIGGNNCVSGPLDSVGRYTNFIISLSNNRIYFIPIDIYKMKPMIDKFVIINSDQVISLKITKNFFGDSFKIIIYTYDNKILFSFNISKYNFISEKFKNNIISFISSFNYNVEILSKINSIKVRKMNKKELKILNIIIYVLILIINVMILIYGIGLILNTKLIGYVIVGTSIITFIVFIRKLKKELQVFKSKTF